MPFGDIIMLHAPRHALESQDVQRHEGDIESNKPEPEGGLAETFVEPESERFWKPEGVAGERSEKDAADDHIVEMGDEEERIVQHEVGRRDSQKHAGHTADQERD